MNRTVNCKWQTRLFIAFIKRPFHLEVRNTHEVTSRFSFNGRYVLSMVLVNTLNARHEKLQLQRTDRLQYHCTHLVPKFQWFTHKQMRRQTNISVVKSCCSFSCGECMQFFNVNGCVQSIHLVTHPQMFPRGHCFFCCFTIFIRSLI